MLTLENIFKKLNWSDKGINIADDQKNERKTIHDLNS